MQSVINEHLTKAHMISGYMSVMYGLPYCILTNIKQHFNNETTYSRALFYSDSVI